ncbi:MAG: hypothetical protein ACOY7J_21820, partial [Pseudomonadota bacterium]
MTTVMNKAVISVAISGIVIPWRRYHSMDSWLNRNSLFANQCCVNGIGKPLCQYITVKVTLHIVLAAGCHGGVRSAIVGKTNNRLRQG